MSNKGKYIIKESELREILQEIILQELYNPDDYAGMHTKDFYSKFNGKVPNAGDLIGNGLKMIAGIPNAIIPDSWKEAAANGKSDIPQWLLDVLGAQKAGTAAADWVPDWWNSKRLGGTGAGVDFGANANAEQPLNVNAACQWLRANTNSKPTHWCAAYVRKALNRGGLGLPHGMPAPSAKYYLNILPANGWDKITREQAGQPCDVVVIDACRSINGRSNYPSGHIAMCLGNGQWASDFMQNTVEGLVNPAPPECIHFFRYRNRV